MPKLYYTLHKCINTSLYSPYILHFIFYTLLSLERQLNLFQKKKQIFLDKKDQLDKQENVLIESGIPTEEKGEFLALENEMQNLKKQRDSFDLAFFSSARDLVVNAYLFPPVSHSIFFVKF